MSCITVYCRLRALLHRSHWFLRCFRMTVGAQDCEQHCVAAGHGGRVDCRDCRCSAVHLRVPVAPSAPLYIVCHHHHIIFPSQFLQFRIQRRCVQPREPSAGGLLRQSVDFPVQSAPWNCNNWCQVVGCDFFCGRDGLYVRACSAYFFLTSCMRSLRYYCMLQVQDEGSSAVMVRCSVHKASCEPLRLMSKQWFCSKLPPRMINRVMLPSVDWERHGGMG